MLKVKSDVKVDIFTHYVQAEKRFDVENAAIRGLVRHPF